MLHRDCDFVVESLNALIVVRVDYLDREVGETVVDVLFNELRHVARRSDQMGAAKVL